MSITREVLTGLGVSTANAEKYLDTLNAAMALHAIDTPLRVAHFLAQLMHESGCLRTTVENMRYSAARLCAVFPRYFPTLAEAQAYANRPERIACRVYGGRMGNGPEGCGDGYRYRGRGLIQLTGKTNYRKFSAWIGEDVVAQPDRVADPLAVQSAVYFWETHGLNALADIDDLNTITRRINGGLNGFTHRLELLEKAKRALKAQTGVLPLSASTPSPTAQAPVQTAVQATHRVTALRLNVRNAPVVADTTRVATLRQGTELEVLGSAGADGWVTVRFMLSGVLREGIVAEAYLESLPRRRGRAIASAAAEPRLPLAPPVHLQQDRADIGRMHDGGRAYPLGEAGRAQRSGRSTAQRVASVSAVVDYLNVSSPAHLRYQPRAGTNHCMTYACDFADLCGVYLPRVWWTDAAIARIARGERVDVVYGETVRELNTNALFDWLEDHGPDHGWYRELDLSTLQAAANVGEVCLMIARRGDLNRAGHISVVVPEMAGAEARRSARADVLRPLESQAGGRNVLRAPSASAWWQHSRFQDRAFWRHP